MGFISFEDTVKKIEIACCGCKLKSLLDDVDEAVMLCSGIIEDYQFPILSEKVNSRLIELGEKK
tara:strand:- start:7805 stop:7996 length:192 start_codon:yes stop_codon:yes gene_type:complete